jgi:hypothetical protein
MASISHLSDTMSVGQTLSTPLLSNLPKHERDERDEDYYDDEAGCTPCSLGIVASDEEWDEVSGDDSSPPSWWNDNSVPWVILPALLFLQFKFGMATTGMCLLVVSSAIALFVVNATLYRKALKDCKLTCTVLLLAPEIFISIIWGLVILDQLATAFLFMEGSILFLAIIGAAITIRSLDATHTVVTLKKKTGVTPQIAGCPLQAGTTRNRQM